MSKKIEIRNSTAEFLIFQIDGKENGVQVMYHDETVWCAQKAMAELFDVGSACDKQTSEKYIWEWGAFRGYSYFQNGNNCVRW